VWVWSRWSWLSCFFPVDYRSGGFVNDDIGFSNSGIVLSFVVGGLTGAAVALLLAPHSGQGTRSLINRRIRDGLDRGQKAGERFASRGREVLEGASNYLGKQQNDFEQRRDRHLFAEAGPQPRNEAGL
jgi:gas vesicle protein